MFKFAHKISSYGDELRVDFNLSKRKRNLRFKNKVLYLKDQTILLKYYHRYWCKFLYVINDQYIYEEKKRQYVLNRNSYTKSACTFCSKLQKQCFCNDKPAIIKSNNDQHWFLNGIRHRDGGLPAVITSRGYQAWYLNGKLHREGGLPAIIFPNGSKYWYLNGISRREGGLPTCIVYPLI